VKSFLQYISVVRGTRRTRVHYGGRLKNYFDEEHEVGVKYATPDMIFPGFFQFRCTPLLSALVAELDETAKPMLARHFAHFSTDYGPSPAAALKFVSCAVYLTCERNRFGLMRNNEHCNVALQVVSRLYNNPLANFSQLRT
jgi:hypothetical protein